jgi:hypothetical protein
VKNSTIEIKRVKSEIFTSECQIDVLHVLIGRDSFDSYRSGLNIVDDGSLEVGNLEMETLFQLGLRQSGQFAEHYSVVSWLH